jgi:SHS2 domain-containing protein
MEKKFEFLEHTADIKFRAFGKTLEEVFENSALAMLNIIYKGKVKEEKKLKIKANGKDIESLLYNFLEEFLFLFDSENFLLSDVKNIKINEKNFTAEAEVVGDDVINYKTSVHVKAITYNEMFVKKDKNKYTAQVVVDV